MSPVGADGGRETAKLNYLLELFKRDLEARLIEVGIAAVKPAIVEAAGDAVKALEPQIQLHFEERGRALVVQFIGVVEKPDG